MVPANLEEEEALAAADLSGSYRVLAGQFPPGNGADISAVYVVAKTDYTPSDSNRVSRPLSYATWRVPHTIPRRTAPHHTTMAFAENMNTSLDGAAVSLAAIKQHGQQRVCAVVSFDLI